MSPFVTALAFAFCEQYRCYLSYFCLFTYAMFLGPTPTPTGHASRPSSPHTNTAPTTSLPTLAPVPASTSPPKLVAHPLNVMTGPTPTVGTSRGVFVPRGGNKIYKKNYFRSNRD